MKQQCRECPDEVLSRGLCKKHYGHAYRNGTLDERAAPSTELDRTKQHRLSDHRSIGASRLANCQVCGPVVLKYRSKRNKWSCPESKSGYDRRRIRETTGVPLDRAEIERSILSLSGQKSCAICGMTEAALGKRLSLDHCHASGSIRGLLCTPCNLGLGLFRDRPELLLAAATYLSP